jgi:hypothetical protein
MDCAAAQLSEHREGWSWNLRGFGVRDDYSRDKTMRADGWFVDETRHNCVVVCEHISRRFVLTAMYKNRAVPIAWYTKVSPLLTPNLLQHGAKGWAEDMVADYDKKGGQTCWWFVSQAEPKAVWGIEALHYVG